MKNLLVFLTIIVFFISCKKDDNEKQNKKPDRYSF